MQQRFSNLRKQFKIGNQNFSLQSCRWRSINFKQNISQQKQFLAYSNNNNNVNKPSSTLFIIPNTRLGQTSIILSNHIYLFGGIPINSSSSSSSSPPDHNFCGINLKNNRWHRIHSKQNPQYRDSNGITLLKNAIYLFGGSNKDKYFNDLYTFNNFTNTWNKIESNNQINRNNNEINSKIPQHRDPIIFKGIKNQYLLLISGINLKQRKYYQDAYIFKNNTWYQLTLINYPYGLIGTKICQCNKKIYLFGGMYHKSNQYNSKFYQLIISEQDLTIEFKQLLLSPHLCPQPRINHQLLPINHQYFLLIGGQKLSKKIFKDIWLFDTFSQQWHKIQPKNGPIKGIHSFSAVFYNNIVYLIGGILENRQEINDQVVMIEFANEDIFKAEICNKCNTVVEKMQQDGKKYPKKLNVSVGFFYNLALEIKFPFHAITMIYEASKYFNPTYFKMAQQKTINEFDYLKFQFDGCSFGVKQFQQFITHRTSSPSLKKLSLSIKLACFRLGKTFLLISSSLTHRFVYLLSAQSRISPHFDQTYIYYTYIQNISLQRIQTEQGIKQKSFIQNILKSYISRPEIVLNIPEKNVLLVFENKIVKKAEKEYLGEIVRRDENMDIVLWKNQEKIRFLEGRGYQVEKDIEVSLSSYMMLYNIHPQKQQQQLKFYISTRSQPIPFISYKQILSHFLSNNLIHPIQPPTLSDCPLKFQCQLYITTYPYLLQNNFGILIYSQNKLINRYSTQLGKLFSKHFYKTKYKKATTVFYQIGWVNLVNGDDGLVKNGMKTGEGYVRLMEEIQKKCWEKRESVLQIERNNQEEVREDSQDLHKGNKKVKIG